MSTGGESRVDWKLLFHQLFALEIKKEFVLGAGDEADELFARLLTAFVLYSPESFNDLIDATIAASTPAEAYRARADFYGHPVSRALISELNFELCIGRELRARPAIAEFLSAIETHRRRALPPDENFFESPEGENICAAFSRDGEQDQQQVALVMVPGYAAHTIKFAIFEEIVADANSFYGRPPERPLLAADGIDLEFENHVAFYSAGNDRPPVFDILHPAGKEHGNTTGQNRETTSMIASWLDELPSKYDNTKFILLGYSKGAPIVLDLVRRHPELSDRVLGYVTHAGVLQGTHVARVIVSQIESLVRDVPLDEFISRLRREDPGSLLAVLSPLFSQLDTSWLSLPRIRSVFEMLGYDMSAQEQQIDRLLGGREIHEVLEGGRDLTPLERVRWSLRYLDNNTFREPTYIYNISALTDVSDFLRPVDPKNGGEAGGSLLAPTFKASGELDWKHFSIDALFLYITSIDGFKSAPGGLFDTQVDLAGSKPLHLDRRALRESLTREELAELWSDDDLRESLIANGVTSIEELASVERSRLIKPENRDNIDSIDLGEFRGHHWSLFRQALPPPTDLSEEHAEWAFPRKAYMRALLQVLALRNIIDATRGPEEIDEQQ